MIRRLQKLIFISLIFGMTTNSFAITSEDKIDALNNEGLTTLLTKDKYELLKVRQQTEDLAKSYETILNYGRPYGQDSSIFEMDRLKVAISISAIAVAAIFLHDQEYSFYHYQIDVGTDLTALVKESINKLQKELQYIEKKSGSEREMILQITETKSKLFKDLKIRLTRYSPAELKQMRSILNSVFFKIRTQRIDFLKSKNPARSVLGDDIRGIEWDRGIVSDNIRNSKWVRTETVNFLRVKRFGAALVILGVAATAYQYITEVAFKDRLDQARMNPIERQAIAKMSDAQIEDYLLNKETDILSSKLTEQKLEFEISYVQQLLDMDQLNN